MLVFLFSLCFLAHAGLLAAALYSLVVIADLESDFVNPHDCAASLNKWLVSGAFDEMAVMGISRFRLFFPSLRPPSSPLSLSRTHSHPLLISSHPPARTTPPTQVPEYATQSATAVLLLLSRAWIPALAHGALSLKLWRGYRAGDATVDVTEVFKQAPAEKRRRAWRLAAYLVSFVYVIYRLVEAAVSSLLTPEGRAAAHKLLVEAAAAPHV